MALGPDDEPPPHLRSVLGKISWGDSTLKYLKQCLAIQQEIGDSAELCVTLLFMSWMFQDMDIFDGQGIEPVPVQLQRERGIAAVIKRVAPYVLLVQEAPSLVELRYFVQANALPYRVAYVRQQRGNRSYADGMAVPVKEGLALEPVQLETPPVPGSRRAARSRYLDWSMRRLLVTRVEGVTIIGVHLKSPGTNPDEDDLLSRFRQAQRLVQYARDLEEPVVVAGDFNDAPGVGDLEKTFRQPDTLSVFDGTFSRDSGDQPTQKKGLNIDHVMARGAGIGSRTVEVVPCSISDHRPVWAVVPHPLVVAKSPRQAFYNLWLEVHGSAYRILKESGAGGKIYDKRCWCYESLEAAEEAFERRVRQKTNPARRGRNYRLAGRGKNAKLSLPSGWRVPKRDSSRIPVVVDGQAQRVISNDGLSRRGHSYA